MGHTPQQHKGGVSFPLTYKSALAHGMSWGFPSEICTQVVSTVTKELTIGKHEEELAREMRRRGMSRRDVIRIGLQLGMGATSCS